MHTLKIFAQVILICLPFVLPSSAFAELQGRIYVDDVVTEDGESFNVCEFFYAFDDGNIGAAEVLYNDWVKRRQKMLENGTKYGILDLFIKHCHARMLYLKKDYALCIAEEDEVLKYLRDHTNERNADNRDWITLKYNSLRQKKEAYYELQDYENSLKAQKDRVDLMTDFQFSRNDRLKAKEELAFLYFKVQDYKSSIAVYKEILPQVEKVFGAKSEDTRVIKCNLAQGYIKVSGYSESAKLLEEILKSDIEVYGETDEKTLESYDNLINVYQNLGRFEEMSVLLNKAVPIAEKNLPDDSDLKKSILARQVIYYMFIGQSKKSLKTLESLKSSISSGDKREEVEALIATSVIYITSNDISSALKCTLQAWDIYEKNFPEDKKLRMNILTSMGFCYLQLNDYNESIKYWQEALDLSTKIYGSDSEETHFLMFQLVVVSLGVNQYDKALELSKRNYDFYVAQYGNDSTAKLFPMIYVALSYYHLGDYKNAITWTKESENEFVRICGEKSFYTYLIRYTLAVSYLIDKQVDESIKILESLPKQGENRKFSICIFVVIALERSYSFVRKSH